MKHLRANYHTHNRLCNHAVGGAEDYVKKAISLNMEEIGLTDHGPILTRFMTKDEYINNMCQRNMSLDVFNDIYLSELDEVCKKYKDQIVIKKGIEIEYIEAEEGFYKEIKSHLDYMNLGVHFFKKDGRTINSFREVTHENVIDYANVAVRGMESGLYKTLVHPDVFMFGYTNINGERKMDEAARKAARIIFEGAIKNNVYLEVNVNGLSNTKRYNPDGEWLYPCKDFWEVAKEYPEAKIIIGIDAHSPEALESDDIEEVINFTKELGLNILPKMEW